METKVLKDIEDLRTISTLKGLDFRSGLKSKTIANLDDAIEIIKKEFPDSTYTCQISESKDGEYELNLFCKNDVEQMAIKLSNVKADKATSRINSDVGIDDLIQCLADIIY